VGTQYKIVGVVKDALMNSPFTAADPTMFICYPQPQNIMMYRLSAENKNTGCRYATNSHLQ
jgi:hypothetical protein